MTKSECIRQQIITHLRTKWRFDNGGSCWYSFSKLAKEIRRPRTSVVREVRRLARSGVLYYTWLCDEEGMLRGAGYLLNYKWERHVEGRPGDPA